MSVLQAEYVNTERKILQLRADLRDDVIEGIDRMIVRALTLRAKRTKGYFSAPSLEYVASFAGVEPPFAAKRIRALVRSGRISEATRGGVRGFIALPDCKFFRVHGDGLSDFDRRFLSEIRVAWDSPLQTDSAGAGRGTRGTEPRAIAAADGGAL